MVFTVVRVVVRTASEGEAHWLLEEDGPAVRLDVCRERPPRPGASSWPWPPAPSWLVTLPRHHGPARLAERAEVVRQLADGSANSPIPVSVSVSMRITAWPRRLADPLESLVVACSGARRPRRRLLASLRRLGEARTRRSASAWRY